WQPPAPRHGQSGSGKRSPAAGNAGTLRAAGCRRPAARRKRGECNVPRTRRPRRARVRKPGRSPACSLIRTSCGGESIAGHCLSQGSGGSPRVAQVPGEVYDTGAWHEEIPMRHDPDGRRLPIKLDSTSNGEFAPMPLEHVHLHANALAQQAADANARRLGLSRRRLLVSAAGAAGTLLAFNEAYAAAGRIGGFYEIEPTAALDIEQAAQQLGSREFVFDVQGHFVGRNWQGRHQLGGVEQFVKDVFLDSDTDMMVLSFIPSRREDEYLPIDEAAAVQEIVERLPRGQRLLIHGRGNPNQPGDLDDIDALASRWKVSALKCYTQ